MKITHNTLSSVGEIHDFMLEACEALVKQGVQIHTDKIQSALQKCTRPSAHTSTTSTTDMLVQVVENNTKSASSSPKLDGVT